MRRFLTAAAAVMLCVTVIAASASARNPGGRDFGGAVFSAGVSGKDGAAQRAFGPATPALDALTRASDDSGVTIALLPEELGTSGTVFIDSQTEPWVDVNPSNSQNLVGMWQEERWSTGGARKPIV